ncbi:MAG TPA: ABC transporter ATP-binding protein [Gemmatimonadales bacterium]|nr:ABC transporter ATP-binding protein [Gemmatimonadales bacterium]
MSAPPAPLLRLEGIEKRYGPVHALRGADFTLYPGEVHALLGENGAGKTTLMQVADGLVRPDAGTIRVGDAERPALTPGEARRFGIGMVHQHFTGIPAFTVAENVALATGWPVSPGPLRERVRHAAEQIGLPLDPDVRTGRLSVGLKQRLEIVKAVAADARILLLDEPTAVLAPAEVAELLDVIRRFTASGGAAVLITHKLDEALAAADRVTVLRRGKVVLRALRGDLDPAGLAAAMIGGEPVVRSAASIRQQADEPAAIRAEALEVARESGYGLALRQGSLEVRPGEIVGIAAVEGNGQRELLRAVAGRVLPLRGRLQVAGPVAFIPEDRISEGLIPELSLTENVVLGSGREEPWMRGGRIDWRAAERYTAELLRAYDVVAAGPRAPASSLSGGNQQKVVIARELSRRPRVVVAENPTRGLDLRATAGVHARLREAAEAGAAVLVHSSDLDEVLELATRVLVVSRGVVAEPPSGEAASREEIGAMMLAGA